MIKSKEDFCAQWRLIRVWGKHRLRYHAAEPVRVLFVVQETSVWAKTAPVAQIMMQSKRFDVTFLCVPGADIKATRGVAALSFTQNNALSFIRERYGELPNVHIIDAQQEQDWVDPVWIKPQPHYVFYTRPYDIYLPKLYRSSRISFYCKCCYIPYGFSTGKSYVAYSNPRDFIQNMTLYFAGGRDELHYVRKTLAPSILRHVRFDGYPALYQWLQCKAVRDGDRPFTVTWTPRWTTDATLDGECSFFKYKQFFLELAQNHPNIRVMVRPHPLALANFVESGQMTKQEVEQFRHAWAQLPNGMLDESGDYVGTLMQTDLLVTDFSSIIVEFFLTGRPIIYCGDQISFTTDFAMVANCFYYVKTQQSLMQQIAAVFDGKDERYEDRQKAIAQLTKSIVKDPRRIVETVLRDYHGMFRAKKLIKMDRL